MVGKICQCRTTAVGECDENIGYGSNDDGGKKNFDCGVDFINNNFLKAFLFLPVSFFFRGLQNVVC